MPLKPGIRAALLYEIVGCSTDRLRKEVNEIVRSGKDDGKSPNSIFMEITNELEKYGEVCDENIGLIASELRDIHRKRMDER